MKRKNLYFDSRETKPGDEASLFFSALVACKNVTFRHTHRSSSFVVVQIHHCAKISALFTSVDKFPRKLIRKMNVVTTSSPLPSCVADSSVSFVTSAGRQFSFATSSRYSMRHSCCCYRVGKSCFPASFNRTMRINKTEVRLTFSFQE